MSKEEKYILVSLEDERSKKIAESISNKTARKILDYLSSKEDAGAEEVSKALKIPLSTVDYNLKNLKKAGLVETKHFIWSKKGKRVILYKLAKKFIVIAPKFSDIKKELKNIIPLIGLAGIISIIIQYTATSNLLRTSLQSKALESSQEAIMAAPVMGADYAVQQVNYGLWFFLGSLFIITVYFLVKLVKSRD